MGKGFKKGRGSSNPLNFRVVGGTSAPSNPRENTIWVNTDQKITGWYFSAVQPENMKEGEVWFLTGTSSPVSFNALKKNNITVYPISAKQYVSGALVDKEVKSYQDGVPVDWWNGQILMPNNTYDDITGGWIADRKFSVTEAEDAEWAAPTVSHEDDVIVITALNNRKGSYHTVKKIDLSEYKSVCIDVQSAKCYNAYATLFVSSTLEGNVQENAEAYTDILTFETNSVSGTFAVDVSGLDQGEYYVGLSFRNYDYEDNDTVMRIKVIFMKR